MPLLANADDQAIRIFDGKTVVVDDKGRAEKMRLCFIQLKADSVRSDATIAGPQGILFLFVFGRVPARAASVFGLAVEAVLRSGRQRPRALVPHPGAKPDWGANFSSGQLRVDAGRGDDFCRTRHKKRATPVATLPFLNGRETPGAWKTLFPPEGF